MNEPVTSPLFGQSDPILEKVRREEDRRELLQKRREQDRVDGWMRVIIPGFLITVTVAFGGWLFSMRDTQNKHDIFIAQLQSGVIAVASDIKELQDTKRSAAGLERWVNSQMNLLEGRISDQDKRLQMQGDGLVAGNRSIHEALESLIRIQDIIVTMNTRISDVERRLDRLQSAIDRSNRR